MLKKIILLLVLSISLLSQAAHSRFIVDADIQGEVAYFLDFTSGEITRYNMDTRMFLPSIDLGTVDKVAKIEVDADGIFVAFDNKVVRYQLDGTNPIQIFSSETDTKEQ